MFPRQQKSPANFKNEIKDKSEEQLPSEKNKREANPIGQRDNP